MLSTSHSSLPDTITITEQCFEEVRSAGAELRVKVSEASVLGRSSGRIDRLRRTLAEREVPERDVLLESISRSSWAWIPVLLGFIVSLATVIGSSQVELAGLVFAGSVVLAGILHIARVSEVNGQLAIHCADVAAVHRALSVVVDMAGAEVQPIAWRYEVGAQSRSEWVVRCIERANQRAAQVAAALGVHIQGVHAFAEEHVQPDAPQLQNGAMDMDMDAIPRRKARSRGTPVDLSSVARAGVTVTIRYRVSAVRPEGGGTYEHSPDSP